MAKVFNGRAATEEYMSTHSLTFSTPDMTLRKFALWLGEPVNLPGGGQGPRLLAYVEEKGGKKESDLSPDIDDSFKPTGAVSDMYSAGSAPASPLDSETLEPEGKFCISCGSKIKASLKFCSKCGSAQG